VSDISGAQTRHIDDADADDVELGAMVDSLPEDAAGSVPAADSDPAAGAVSGSGPAAGSAAASAAGSASDEDDEDDDEDEEDDEAEGGGRQGKAADLFRESEIAADYVEGLLDILDYDGDIDELVSGGRPMVEVVGGRLNALVGTRGATLESLQELARLAIFRQTGTPSRLLLDVGGYRATRRKELGAIAKNAAEKVKEHGEAIRLEPMSAFERKCVHDVINALAGVESESEGVEPSRRIVVRPVT
jgi:spoIIIJ-associated protein